MNTKPYHYYLDFLRLFAAVSVIYMHTAATGLRVGVLPEGGVTRGWFFINFFTSLAFTAVPLFFMISGFLLLSDPKTLDTTTLLHHRLPRLIVPLAVWSAVAVLREGGSVPDMLLRFVGAFYAPVLMPFWFMYSLIVFYLLSPILRGGIAALDQKGHRFVLILIALVSLRTVIKNFLPADLTHWADLHFLTQLQALGGYLLLFVLGYYLGNFPKHIPNAVLIAIAVLTFAVINLGTWRLTLQNNWYTQDFQDQSAGFEVVLASCLFLLAKQNLNYPAKILQNISPLFFPVYFLHAPLILILYYNFGIDPLRFPQIVGCTVLNFFLSLLIAKTLASIKPLCYAFTGIPFIKACQSCNWQYTLRQRNSAERT